MRRFLTLAVGATLGLAPVLAGLRNSGQRSLEIAVGGNLDAAQAEAAFQNQLQKIIQSGSGSVPAGGLK